MLSGLLDGVDIPANRGVQLSGIGSVPTSRAMALIGRAGGVIERVVSEGSSSAARWGTTMKVGSLAEFRIEPLPSLESEVSIRNGLCGLVGCG